MSHRQLVKIVDDRLKLCVFDNFLGEVDMNTPVAGYCDQLNPMVT